MQIKRSKRKHAFYEEFLGYAKNRLQNSALFLEKLDLGAFVRLFCVKGYSKSKILLQLQTVNCILTIAYTWEKETQNETLTPAIAKICIKNKVRPKTQLLNANC